MNTSEIISALDAEIARLQHVRSVIAGLSPAKRRGRPPASVAPMKTLARKTFSAVTRKKIADAQRKRWALQKATSKDSAAERPAKKVLTKIVRKRPTKKVTVTKIPPKQQHERKPRASKSTAVKHALSSKSETVAVPKNNGQTIHK